MLVDKIKRGSCSFRVQRSGHICYLKMWLKLNLCGQLSGGYFAGDGDRGLYSVCGLFTWQERQVRDLSKKRGRVQWRGRRTIWDEWWTRIYCMLSGRGGNEIMLSLAAVTQLKSGRAVFSLEASDTVCSYIEKNWKEIDRKPPGKEVSDGALNFLLIDYTRLISVGCATDLQCCTARAVNLKVMDLTVF